MLPEGFGNLILRKCGSAGNRNRDLWVCSQELYIEQIATIRQRTWCNIADDKRKKEDGFMCHEVYACSPQ
jgi:hypothetical protein